MMCVLFQIKNAEFFTQFITEDFDAYINRKRNDGCHGNHLEMQAMAELYNRTIEVYQYSTGCVCSVCVCVVCVYKFFVFFEASK